MKSFAIIGTGAIGGYCAIKLQQAGFTVHCLLGRDYAFVKQHGLTLLSEQETLTVPINAYKDAAAMPACDVILIALKTTANDALRNILPQLMHAQTAVVILQNGVGIESEIAEFVDAGKIIGGSCALIINKQSPGVIKHIGFNTIDLAQYYVNEQQKGITQQVIDLADCFNKAGIESTPQVDLFTMRWKKIVRNIPVNGLSVVLNASMQDLVSDPAILQLLLKMTEEGIVAGIKCDAKLTEDFFELRRSQFEALKKMPKSYPSTKVDFDAKQPMELHAIYENAIHIAKQHNASMPLTEMLYQQLKYLDERNTSNL